ncbi:hypothetical protein PLANPX_5131 [Lacipirellula parvula]|uniref:Uncharacterized protein n=1 Tax=Lacipirellula parvula TaxID=2650471 RepID=A0A5K7XPW5_9BACT|nr:hypothetical protein PLANPX_5131 [Lacipirellula parvula]
MEAAVARRINLSGAGARGQQKFGRFENACIDEMRHFIQANGLADGRVSSGAFTQLRPPAEPVAVMARRVSL